MNIEYVLKICQSVNTEDVEKKQSPGRCKKRLEPWKLPSGNLT